MPSKSPAQHRLMEDAAHDPAFAEKSGVPQGVAKEFVAADSRQARGKRMGGVAMDQALPHGYGR